MAAIGIDLGTTYSCVAWRSPAGEVQILTNDQGARTSPSYVCYTETERLVGAAAKAMAQIAPASTVYDAKRLIGRRYSEITDQYSYQIRERAGQPVICVDYLGQSKEFRPEEVSAVVLEYLKRTAEAALGTTVRDAVITVPAYFNDSQRQATRDAGRLAGLNVIRILNEPTAAAMAYGLAAKSDTAKTILVFDFGGGTFDVTLLVLEQQVYQVLATAGDTHLGGEDIDSLLVDYLLKAYQEARPEAKLLDVPKIRRQLRPLAEAAKRTLSAASTTLVDLSGLTPGLGVTLSRAKFNQLCAGIWERLRAPLDRALTDAKLKPNQVDEIVMVGGSSRIPKVQDLVLDYFGGKQLNLTVNPDEAVAYGAAVQAAILAGAAPKLDIVLVDVTPLSLGVATLGGLMDIVIPRQKTVPCRVSKVYSPAHDNQTAVTIEVYEGERSRIADNRLLGSFTVAGLPPLSRGACQVEITFQLDNDGILRVSATEKLSGRTEGITITRDQSRLSEAEIEQKLQEAERFRAADEEARAVIRERNQLEEYLLAAASYLDKLADPQRAELSEILEEGQRQLEQKTDSNTLRRIRSELSARSDPLIMAACNSSSQPKPDADTKI
jgi:L1 cell adhesion molecule like protein